ncbi:MAG TPA: hypothetical protein VFQ98_01425, partial [Gallionella sp.]|nr:hypothetical protein [Gallionella sp.]
TMGLLVAGYEQSQIERAIEGSSWAGYFAAQSHPWFQQGIFWRMIFGGMLAAGYALLILDLLTIGRRETKQGLRRTYRWVGKNSSQPQIDTD